MFLRLADREISSLEAPEGYIFRMAANLLADRARRNKVRTDNTLSILQAETSVDPLDPARIAEGRQSLAALEAALRDLPEPTRSDIHPVSIGECGSSGARPGLWSFPRPDRPPDRQGNGFFNRAGEGNP